MEGVSYALVESSAQDVKGNVIIDGRNIYDKAEAAENGFVYYKIG